MLNFKLAVLSFLSFATLASCHYTFPYLVLGGQSSAEWQYIRQTNNHWSNGPVTDVKSQEFRCYTTGTVTTGTATVQAGQTIGIRANGGIGHPGVANVYMAKAPNSVNGWDASGNVWFKVHEVSAVTDGGKSISWPSSNSDNISFTLPKSLPNGEYLVRVEHIALHGANSVGGAQFYLSCAQIKVTNGGNGNPGPLVAIPGVYNGNEPGIVINIYWPVPTSYTQPGPAVWRG